MKREKNACGMDMKRQNVHTFSQIIFITPNINAFYNLFTVFLIKFYIVENDMYSSFISS